MDIYYRFYNLTYMNGNGNFSENLGFNAILINFIIT
jgi:hypothetical protein